MDAREIFAIIFIAASCSLCEIQDEATRIRRQLERQNAIDNARLQEEYGVVVIKKNYQHHKIASPAKRPQTMKCDFNSELGVKECVPVPASEKIVR